MKQIVIVTLLIIMSKVSNAQNIDTMGKVIQWGNIELTINSYSEDNSFSYFKFTLCNKGTENINPIRLLYDQGLREDDFYETDQHFRLENGVKSMWSKPNYYSKVLNVEEILLKKKWKKFKLKENECVVWNCKFNKIDRNKVNEVNLIMGDSYSLSEYPVVTTTIRLNSYQEEIQYLADIKSENEKRQLEREKQKNKDEEEAKVKAVLENERKENAKIAIANGTYNGWFNLQLEKYYYWGNFKNGKPSGSGKWENFNDGSEYEGEFLNGVENGQGTLKAKNGIRYSGNFTDGLPNGNFKIVEYGLFGAVSNQWDAVYEMGELKSSNQTGSTLNDFLSGKTARGQQQSKVENSTIPKVKKCSFDKTISPIGEGEHDRYFVTFEDGKNGFIYFWKYHKEWHINSIGSSDYQKFNSKEDAIKGLYLFESK